MADHAVIGAKHQAYEVHPRFDRARRKSFPKDRSARYAYSGAVDFAELAVVSRNKRVDPGRISLCDVTRGVEVLFQEHNRAESPRQWRCRKPDGVGDIAGPSLAEIICAALCAGEHHGFSFAKSRSAR